MSNGYATEDLEAILESLESDESDESDEMAERIIRRRGRPRINTAPGTGLVPPKPQAGYVTEARLQAALARVGAQIKTNSDAIKEVNTRLSAINAEQTRQAAALKKAIAEQKKETAVLKNNIQLAALLPLLIRPATRTITKTAGGLTEGDKVLIDSGDSLSALLPLLLLGGMGSAPADGASSGLGGGFNDPTTMLLVVLAASGKL